MRKAPFLLAALALGLAAQAPYKVNVKLVRLLVNVKDAHGELVASAAHRHAF